MPGHVLFPIIFKEIKQEVKKIQTYPFLAKPQKPFPHLVPLQNPKLLLCELKTGQGPPDGRHNQRTQVYNLWVLNKIFKRALYKRFVVKLGISLYQPNQVWLVLPKTRPNALWLASGSTGENNCTCKYQAGDKHKLVGKKEGVKTCSLVHERDQKIKDQSLWK